MKSGNQLMRFRILFLTLVAIPLWIACLSPGVQAASRTRETVLVPGITATREGQSVNTARSGVLDDLRQVAIKWVFNQYAGKSPPPLRPSDLDAAVAWITLESDSQTATSYSASATVAIDRRWLEGRLGHRLQLQPSPPDAPSTDGPVQGEPDISSPAPTVDPPFDNRTDQTVLAASLMLSFPVDRAALSNLFAAIPGLHVETVALSPDQWSVLLRYNGSEQSLNEHLNRNGYTITR
jgi:hypothetical protein